MLHYSTVGQTHTLTNSLRSGTMLGMEFNYSWEQQREFTRSALACPHPNAKPLGWVNSYMFGWLMPEVFKINGIVLSRADFGCLILLMKFLLWATETELKYDSKLRPLEVKNGPTSNSGTCPRVSQDKTHVSDLPVFLFRVKKGEAQS